MTTTHTAFAMTASNSCSRNCSETWICIFFEITGSPLLYSKQISGHLVHVTKPRFSTSPNITRHRKLRRHQNRMIQTQATLSWFPSYLWQQKASSFRVRLHTPPACWRPPSCLASSSPSSSSHFFLTAFAHLSILSPENTPRFSISITPKWQQLYKHLLSYV
jgi:hypothetical protein